MDSIQKKLEAIQTISMSFDRLQAFAFPLEEMSHFLNYVTLAAFRHQLGEDRPLLIGFIGCTGTGKSTIFNSLVGRTISETGWQAHNTCGPVLISHKDFLSRVESKESQNGRLLFPYLKRDVQHLNANTLFKSNGQADSLNIAIVDDPLWKKRVLIDLPDINTTLAKDEQLIAQQVMPWLDIVIFVVDDETLYHREYENPTELSKELKQSCICVLNNRGRDRVELDHPDVKGVMQFFGVDTIHVLPPITYGDRFQDEEPFIRFRNTIFDSYKKGEIEPVIQKCTPLASEIIGENRRRKTAFLRLERKISETIENIMTAEQPVSFKSVLNDEVLSALDHLGLKRFAISNLFHFLKQIGTTGSLTRSFQLAFGENRDKILTNAFAMDNQKLEDEIHNRLTDYCEKISTLIHRHEESELLFESNPALRTLSFIKEMPLRQMLEDITKEFEEECREALSADKLVNAFSSDPLVTTTILVVLLADVFTVPGFGSWLLVPTAVKFLPIGKFEKIKRRFQQAIRDVMQEALSLVIMQIQTTKSQLFLEEGDALYTALSICAGYDED